MTLTKDGYRAVDLLLKKDALKNELFKVNEELLPLLNRLMINAPEEYNKVFTAFKDEWLNTRPKPSSGVSGQK